MIKPQGNVWDVGNFITGNELEYSCQLTKHHIILLFVFLRGLKKNLRHFFSTWVYVAWKKHNPIYDTVYLRALKSRRDGKLNLVLGTKKEKKLKKTKTKNE